MRELQSLLRELDPPAGGLARLRRRLDAANVRQHRARTAWRWGVALALPALALALLLPAPIRQWQRTHALTRAMRQAMHVAAPAGGLEVSGGAALPLPSGQANVHLYLVQTTATAQPPAGKGKPR